MGDLSSYQDIKAINNSRMTEVFRAFKADDTKTQVILRKIRSEYSDNTALMNILTQEAQNAMQLNHPNIVKIIDFFKDNDQFYLVTEDIRGISLQKLLLTNRLENRNFKCEEALYIAAEISHAMHYAHTLQDHKGKNLNIVHMNLNPKNILITEKGGVKINDFAFSLLRIKTGNLIEEVKNGKSCYLSPEVLLNANIVPQSDIYSIGVILYEMLSSHHPFSKFFKSVNIQTLIDMQTQPLSDFLHNLQPGINELVNRAMEKDVQKRLPDAMILYENLMKFDLEDQAIKIKNSISKYIPNQVMNEHDDMRTIPLGLKKMGKRAGGWKSAEKNAATVEQKQPKVRWQWIVAGSIVVVLGGSLLIYRLKSKPTPFATAAVVEKPVEEANAPEPKPESLPVNRKIVTGIPDNYGELNFIGPSGTQIYINERKVGVLPMKRVVLKHGAYNILMKTKDEGEKTKFVNVLSQQSVEISWW